MVILDRGEGPERRFWGYSETSNLRPTGRRPSPFQMRTANSAISVGESDLSIRGCRCVHIEDNCSLHRWGPHIIPPESAPSGSRGSNPNTDQRNALAAKRLTNSRNSLSGNCQESGVSEWLDLSSIDARLRFVIDAWQTLGDQQMEEIIATCRSNSER